MYYFCRCTCIQNLCLAAELLHVASWHSVRQRTARVYIPTFISVTAKAVGYNFPFEIETVD